MPVESVRMLIELERYRSQQGKPVCERNREEGEICIFLDDPLVDEEGVGFCRCNGVVLQEVDRPDWPGQCSPCAECVVWKPETEVVGENE